MTPTTLVSMKEAARRLAMSVRSVQRRIEEGQLVKTKIGARALIEERELERFIRKHREPIK